MPILKNPRWEKFCNLYVLGETVGNGTASYLAAGFQISNRNDVRARRLLKHPEVQARLAELQAELARITAEATGQTLEKLAITKETVMTELARIGFANIADYVRHNEHGELIVDLASVSRDKAAGLIAVRFVERINSRGERVRDISIRLGEKRAALVDLGKHLGLFMQPEPSADADAIDPETEAELERRIAAAVREIAEARVARAAVSFSGAEMPVN